MFTSKRNSLKPIPLFSLIAVTIGFLMIQASTAFGEPTADPVVSIGDATETEGDTGSSAITFTLTRTGTVAELGVPSAVSVSSGFDTATENDDYEPLSTNVLFGSGEVTKTVTVTITNDTIVETDETFNLTIAPILNASIGTGTATGTILDNDEAKVSLVADASALENSGTLDFEVEISNAVSADVTVNFSATDISAVLGVDYSTPSMSVTFPANTTASQTASVTLINDATVEADEQIEVSLGAVSASGLPVEASTDTVEGTIENDDTATVLITHAQPVYEGSTVLYTANLSANVDGGVTVDYATTSILPNGASAPTDFDATSGSLAFTGNTTQAITFTVNINDDIRVENDESFAIDLTFDSAPTVAPASITPLTPITTTIINTDTTTLDLVGGTIVEEGDSGTTDVSFTLSLASGVKGDFTVPIIVTGQTATAGVDFIDASQTITFEQGDTTKSFTVTILSDEIVESDETFSVTLGDPVGTLIDGSAIIPTGIPQIVTIKDDDIAVITLSGPTGSSLSESFTNYPFGIKVDKEVEGGFFVTYATSDGTATSSGAAADYVNSADQVEFDGLAGEIEAVGIQINPDTIVEANETFNLNLLSVQDAENNDITDRFTFSDDSITGIITNDDVAQITLDFSPLDLTDGVVKVEEGDTGSQTYQARAILTSNVQGGLSVDYTLSGGTATPGTDYESTSGTLTFNGNSTSGVEVKAFNIVVYGDPSEEENETFIVALDDIANTNVPLSDIEIGNSPSTFEITNDDGTIVTVSADPNEVLENTTAVEFTIELDSPSFETVTVEYTTANDTAQAGNDFVSTTDEVTFAPGETIKNVTVFLLNDGVSEANEMFFLELSDASNATIGTENRAAITIIDDDGLPTVTLSSGTYQISEGSVGIPITVTKSRLSSQEITVLVNFEAGTASAPQDFETINIPVTFAANEVNNSTTFMLTVKDDSVFERDEAFTIKLDSYVNAEAGETTEATVNIVDNDLAPLISISDVSVSEADNVNTMNFEVSLSEIADVDLSVSYETQDGTARVADGDYVASAGRLIIPAGSLSAIIEITINGDNLGEGDETFSVILSAPSDDNLDPTANGSIATGTLENDDFFQVMLPVIINGRINAPDLVPVGISVNGDSISISIQNRGSVAVNNQFWVDLFVDPSVLPTKPNHTTETLRETGLVWLVSGASLPINPGQTITIKSGDSNFQPDFSEFTGTIPAGTLLVAHVDSANSATDFGAIEETHEQNNGIYNNILNSTTSRAVVIR